MHSSLPQPCCLIGLCTTHRADSRHERSCVAICHKKNRKKKTIEPHFPNAQKTAPKIGIILLHPTCLNQKMLHSEYIPNLEYLK